MRTVCVGYSVVSAFVFCCARQLSHSREHSLTTKQTRLLYGISTTCLCLTKPSLVIATFAFESRDFTPNLTAGISTDLPEGLVVGSSSASRGSERSGWDSVADSPSRVVTGMPTLVVRLGGPGSLEFSFGGNLILRCAGENTWRPVRKTAAFFYPKKRPASYLSFNEFAIAKT
jgi:hypothetical protein